MVAIKDMDMPKCCENCDYFKGENTYCARGCFIPFNSPCDEKRPPNCPLVEIEERKVGKWIGEKEYPICDKCGCNIYEKYISCSDYAEIIEKMDYCPNCGAEMVGSENDI